MSVVGGLRTRFLYDSVFNALYDGMETLGWFDTDRRHRPVTFISEPIGDVEEVQLNTMAFSDGPMFDNEAEIGSNMTASEYGFYIDIYGESGPLGRALANDFRDLIKGRHGGRTGPVFTIYDLSLATPTSIGYAEVERVNIHREDTFTRPWQKFWYSVRFDVVDYYYGEDDPGAPSDDFYGGY